jgi:hypothetical protein
MSMTQRPSAPADLRGDAVYRESDSHRETRLFAKTSEFWAMLVGIGLIAVIYNIADDESFNLWRACLLATAIAVGYIVSRGIAKSGSHDDRWTDTTHRH